MPVPNPDLVPQAAVDLVKGFEGFRSKPYRCPAGVWTIGYGTTHGVTEHTPAVTPAQAAVLLKRDLREAGHAVELAVDVPINDNQRSALISFVYNVGPTAFENSTLLEKLNDGDYAGAFDELPRWNKGGGKVLPGLVTRRSAEQRLASTPVA